MGMLSLMAAVLALLSTLWLQNESTLSKNADSTETAAIASNMMVYRAAVSQYAYSHPTVVETVPDSLLELPTWYQRISGIHHYFDKDKDKDASYAGYIYFSSPRPGLVYQLLKASDNSIKVGINQDGILVNPLSQPNYSPPTTLPSAIPIGSVVYAF